MTVPLPAAEPNNAASIVAAKMVPTLAHRMVHDKSILALAVSAQYIFAGTQGGEILVSVFSESGRKCMEGGIGWEEWMLTTPGIQPRHVRPPESDSRS
jgi:hypothetical protein